LLFCLHFSQIRTVFIILSDQFLDLFVVFLSFLTHTLDPSLLRLKLCTLLVFLRLTSFGQLQKLGLLLSQVVLDSLSHQMFSIHLLVERIDLVLHL